MRTTTTYDQGTAPNVHIMQGHIPVLLIDDLAACTGPCTKCNAWDCYWSHIEDGVWCGPGSCQQDACIKTEAVKIRKAEEQPSDYLNRDNYESNELPYTTGYTWIAGRYWKFDIYRDNNTNYVTSIYTEDDKKIDISETKIVGQAWFAGILDESEDWDPICLAAWRVLRRLGIIW